METTVFQLIVESRRGRQSVALRGEPITLGRAPENSVVLADPRVSRFHARIEPCQGGWRVVDLGSQNGTIQRGRRISSSVLALGERVQLGTASLWLEPVETESPVADLTVTVRSEADAQRLRRLGDVARALTSVASEESIFKEVVDAALDVTPSERGFLLLARKDGFHFAAARNFEGEDLERPEFQVSWSIAIHVGTHGEPLMLVNAAEDERFRSFESVGSLSLRSLLCVPIKGPRGILGVIYVDNALHRAMYDERDRDVLEVLADHAGVALMARRMADEAREQRQKIEALSRRLASEVEEKESELTIMRAQWPDAAPRQRGFDALIGSSARMEELRHLLAKAANTDFPVLVQGESGTGKELVARCLHDNSDRRRRNFLALNCAAIPESLLESELFGHERGAFTGADQKKAGLFEAAHGGTLFLDEVAEMSPALQSRLLRVLQEGEIRAVGGQQTVSVDVRVIAACNQDLHALVKAGAFREDLYYRLKVLPVDVPPLRDRRDDIPALLRHFFSRLGPEAPLRIEPAALDILMSYRWPGNVRELENEVKRLLVVASDPVRASDLSPHVAEAGSLRVGRDSSYQDLGALVEAVETTEIRKALTRADGNKTRAAALLGISRFTLQRKLEKYGLDDGSD